MSELCYYETCRRQEFFLIPEALELAFMAGMYDTATSNAVRIYDVNRYVLFLNHSVIDNLVTRHAFYLSTSSRDLKNILTIPYCNYTAGCFSLSRDVLTTAICGYIQKNLNSITELWTTAAIATPHSLSQPLHLVHFFT